MGQRANLSSVDMYLEDLQNTTVRLSVDIYLGTSCRGAKTLSLPTNSSKCNASGESGY